MHTHRYVYYAILQAAIVSDKKNKKKEKKQLYGEINKNM